MCGRYVQTVPFEVLARWMEGTFETPASLPDLPPRWNIAPTLEVLAMRHDPEGRRVLGGYRWGLAAPWMDALPRFPTHNARVETVAERPTFREAWRRGQRLLVPADGYYEWQVVSGGTKSKPATQPWYVTPTGESQLAFAGLFAWWRPKGTGDDRPWLATCTVLTSEPGPDLSDIHDRQPVVLPRDRWDVWLDPHTSADEARSLLGPAPPGTFRRHRVGKAVGNSKNEGPSLIAELIEP